jgi:hypothetical protein
LGTGAFTRVEYFEVTDVSPRQYDKITIRRAYRGVPERTTVTASYGQVLNIYSFQLPIEHFSIVPEPPSRYVYAEIRSVKLDQQTELGMGFKYYKAQGPFDMIDISLINSKIGRFVHTGTGTTQQWALVDRTNLVSGHRQLEGYSVS